MIHTHFVHLKDLSGMIKHTVVINVVMKNLFMIKLKRHVVFVLNRKISTNVQENVYQNLSHLNVLQMSIITHNLNNVKKEEQLQCVHLQHHTGILLTLNVSNVQQINHHLIKKHYNVKNVLLINNGQQFINTVYQIVHLDNNGIMSTKNVLKLIRHVHKNRLLVLNLINALISTVMKQVLIGIQPPINVNHVLQKQFIIT